MSASPSDRIVDPVGNRSDRGFRGLAAGLLTILALSGMDASASQGNVPRVFKGIPQEKGLWRMELFTGQPPATLGGGPPLVKSGFSVCMDSLAQLAKGNGAGAQTPTGAGLGKCRSTVTDDDNDRAVIETHCENDQHYRTEVSRSGPKEFLLDVSGTVNGKAFDLKSRYTYEGSCPKQATGSGTQN